MKPGTQITLTAANMQFSLVFLLFTSVTSAFGAAVPGAAREVPPASNTEAENIFAEAEAHAINLGTIPAWDAVPALNLTPIITGEGLPTLEDLGLSWSDLLSVKLPGEPDSSAPASGMCHMAVERVRVEVTYTTMQTGHSQKAKRDLVCHWNLPVKSLRLGQLCGQYLASLGETNCWVPGGMASAIRFCARTTTTGQTVEWFGRSTNQFAQQTSW